MKEIFVSYAREDQERVRSIVSWLEQEGFTVFWDREVPTGKTWRSHIGTALAEARCVIVAWSKHSLDSQWVAEEAEEGRARGALLPVLLDPVQPPFGFRSLQAADFSNWRRGDPQSQRLLTDIRALLGTPPPKKDVPAPANQSTSTSVAANPSFGASGRPRPWLSRRVTVSLGIATLAAAVATLAWTQGWIGPRVTASPPPANVQASERYTIYLHLGSAKNRFVPKYDDIEKALGAQGLRIHGVDDKWDDYGPGVDYFYDDDRKAAEAVAAILSGLRPAGSPAILARQQKASNDPGTLGLWF